MVSAPIDETAYANLVTNLGDRYWRLNNLYRIINKDGVEVPFRFNAVQELLYQNLHNANIVLKSRQHGVSTFCEIFILDDCLFYPNISSGIIADNLDDAKELMRTKIVYPYTHLPPELRAAIPLTSETKMDLVFANNSKIFVDTSMRSATIQNLHISEFGKICAQFPERAREIVTGSLNAIQPNQRVFIESTAEGQSGYFYEYCKTAQDMQISGHPLTAMDFKFHFYAWWEDPGNRLSDSDTEITTVSSRLMNYFRDLNTKYGIDLDRRQMAWYVKKEQSQQQEMKREHPSHPDEAWEQTLEGAYYSNQFRYLREHKQITKVPHEPGVPVDTWWDLGINDDTSIWFTQDVGREIHVIDFYANSGEALSHYAQILQDLAEELGYYYGKHFAPHDIRVRELSTGRSRIEVAAENGISFDIGPKLPVVDGIEAVRRILPQCWFDETNCSEGIAHLEQYRKEWNERLGTFRNRPLHDNHSHAADAFRTLAVCHKFRDSMRRQRRQIKRVNAAGWT